MHAYRENSLLCDTRKIDMVAVVILYIPLLGYKVKLSTYGRVETGGKTVPFL